MKWTSVLLSAEAGYDHTAERVWDCVALNPVEAPEGDQRWEECACDLWSAVLPQADHTSQAPSSHLWRQKVTKDGKRAPAIYGQRYFLKPIIPRCICPTLRTLIPRSYI